MTRTKVGAIVTGLLTLVYILLLGQRGWLLAIDDEPIAKVMGIFILALPIFGAVGLYSEFKFGFSVEKLGKQLEAEGAWPAFDFEVRPSGRVVRASADRVFDEYQAKAEADQQNWRSWFSLGLAYDAAGDRSRARGAMRKAIDLAKN